MKLQPLQLNTAAFDEQIEQLAERIQVTRGRHPADLLLKNAKIVQCLTGEIIPGSLALFKGRIVGIGDYQAKEQIDLRGAYLSPGLIEGHFHLESTLLTPAEFVRAALPLGTTAGVADPHEIANVAGLEGIEFLLETGSGLPFSFYFMAPSCVPASSLEDSGAHLGSAEIAQLLQNDRVLGLGEVMDYPSVLAGDPQIISKILLSRDRLIDGHAPDLLDQELEAYAAAGIDSDHESSKLKEGREKLRAGLTLMIRQGSVAQNLQELLPLAQGAANERCLLVSDDLIPKDLVEHRHLAGLLALAVKRGMDPVMALRLVTLNPANYFRLRDMGRITPGAWADLVVFKDISDFRVQQVFHHGKIVAENGHLTVPLHSSVIVPDRIAHSVHLAPISGKSFQIQARGDRCRVIGLIPDQLLTESLEMDVLIQDGLVQTVPNRDLLKIAVIERHHASGRISLGLVHGFGLLHGALASSISHDAHNLVVIGTNDQDMLVAAREVERIEGGLAVADHGKLLGSLALPIAGLISDLPVRIVSRQLTEIEDAARALGTPPNHPFMALSFLTLSVIPALKITSLGLVDSVNQQIVDLFV